MNNTVTLSPLLIVDKGIKWKYKIYLTYKLIFNGALPEMRGSENKSNAEFSIR